jgi:hypothetical protein
MNMVDEFPLVLRDLLRPCAFFTALGKSSRCPLHDLLDQQSKTKYAGDKDRQKQTVAKKLASLSYSPSLGQDLV